VRRFIAIRWGFGEPAEVRTVRGASLRNILASGVKQARQPRGPLPQNQCHSFQRRKNGPSRRRSVVVGAIGIE
jgi:hypothetical protein